MTAFDTLPSADGLWTGLRGLDGSAWYHPLRLTIDSGAVAAGNPGSSGSAGTVRPPGPRRRARGDRPRQPSRRRG